MGNKMNEKINVLDNGYVRLTNVMGSDLSVVNSARVSYDKESTELDEKDIRLIKFLARERHTSPFRHATLQFEVYAPLMVARRIGSTSSEPITQWTHGTNQAAAILPKSLRFIFRNRTNGVQHRRIRSKDPVRPYRRSAGFIFTDELEKYIERGEELYNFAMEHGGICAEQARLFLPAYGMYVRYYWTASLQSVTHFLNQRLAHDSQAEIQEYAKAVYALAKPKFPVSLGELVKTEV
nr:FAD-dependent thymidylate synthase [Bacillus subtilis]